MKDNAAFGRFAAIMAVSAGVLILVSTFVLFLAIEFDMSYLANPAALLTAGLDAGAIRLFGWGSILELLGSFLFLIPVTVYLWQWLRARNPNLVNLATLFALGSIFFGMMGAALRASFWPSMMSAYPQVAEAQRQVLQIVFGAMNDFTFESLYGLDSIFAGVWWLGIGLVLRRERRLLGIVTLIMGAAILVAGAGWLFHVDPLARMELFYFFEPFWAVWLGVIIWWRTAKREQLTAAATAA